MTIAVPVDENLDTKGKVLKVFQFLRADANLGGVMCPTCCRVADDQGKLHRSTDCWALQPAVAGQDFGCTKGFSPELTGQTTQAFGRSWQEFRCKNSNEQEAWIELFPPDDYAIPQNPQVVKAITMSFSAFVAVVVPTNATDAGGSNMKDESRSLSKLGQLLSRHEIVLIALSASFGVISCCVGTFLTWRLYIRWKRMHCQRYDPVIQDNPDPESGVSGSVNAGQVTTEAVGKQQDGASGLSRRDLISSYHRSRLLEGKSSVLDGTVVERSQHDLCCAIMYCEGVGLVFRKDRYGLFHVLATTKGSPAEATALINKGDVLMNVNGQAVVGKSLAQIKTQIVGPRGTPVKLVFERPLGSTTSRYEVCLCAESDVRASALRNIRLEKVRVALESSKALGGGGDATESSSSTVNRGTAKAKEEKEFLEIGL